LPGGAVGALAQPEQKMGVIYINFKNTYSHHTGHNEMIFVVSYM